MIRCKHDIDTKLVNFFISENKFDEDINEALITWYSSLGDKDHQVTRDNAVNFLKGLARKVLTEIDYPLKEREELVKVFDPLELLLRTALSIREPNQKPSFVRDHLSHTVRNVLFTNYLLKKYNPENHSSWRMQLFITAIFHDIAYPIEKIKKVGKQLGASTFKTLLNSEGEVEFTLSNPDDLLKMMNFFGNTLSALETNLEKIKKEKGSEGQIKKAQITFDKIELIYREIISVAIAGQGLFDTSHSLSSVILFLMPIIKKWADSKSYQETNLDNIADICLAMAYHDRQNIIQKITKFEVPLILKIMRLSDELQEWDRESNSFIKDAYFVNDVSTLLTFHLIMRNKGDYEYGICKPELFIPDKISGLLPILTDGEIIKLFMVFPVLAKKDLIIENLKKYDTELISGKAPLSYIFKGKEEGNNVNIFYSNNIATIQIN